MRYLDQSMIPHLQVWNVGKPANQISKEANSKKSGNPETIDLKSVPKLDTHYASLIDNFHYTVIL